MRNSLLSATFGSIVAETARLPSSLLLIFLIPSSTSPDSWATNRNPGLLCRSGRPFNPSVVYSIKTPLLVPCPNARFGVFAVGIAAKGVKSPPNKAPRASSGLYSLKILSAKTSISSE